MVFPDILKKQYYIELIEKLSIFTGDRIPNSRVIA